MKGKPRSKVRDWIKDSEVALRAYGKNGEGIALVVKIAANPHSEVQWSVRFMKGGTQIKDLGSPLDDSLDVLGALHEIVRLVRDTAGTEA